MWSRIAELILRYRWVGLAGVFLLTCWMAYIGVSRLEVSQEYLNVIPPDDPDKAAYQNFLKEFGEEGNTLIIALEGKATKDSSFWFDRAKLNDFYHTGRKIAQLKDVVRIVNVTQTSYLTLNEEEKRFAMQAFMPAPFTQDSQVKHLRNVVSQQPFYRGLLFSEDYRTALCAVTFSMNAMSSKRKHLLQKEIEALIQPFAAKYGIQIHYAGVPYMRTYMAKKLPAELGLFVLASLLLTAIALFYFYRTFYAVVFPILLLLISAVWTLGIVAMLGYKLSLLMGMLPATIIILGIPPSIYMLSDYLEEYRLVQDKKKALIGMINRLGLVTLMINANTAFGFLTLYAADITILREFGLTAFLATMAAYFLTLLLIPGIFSILPPPSEKNIRQIEIPLLRRFVVWINAVVQDSKKLIYITTVVILAVASLGIRRLEAVSHMSDDFPTRDTVMTDLRFMESNFGGVLPFEIVIDFQKAGATKKVSNLARIAELQDSLSADPRISRTISIVDAIKWSRQAMYGGEAVGYDMPARNEIDLIARYMQGAQRHQDSLHKDKPLLTANLTDSTFRKVRITGYVKDLGSKEMPLLIEKTNRQIKDIFQDQQPPVQSLITGTTRIFLKMNEYLIDNLVWSLAATFLIIGLQMWVLFASLRMMIISLAVNVLPLAVTAGIMGYLNIPLKPSTALIYELAFGIAIDNSIHYLTAYRYYRKKGEAKADAITGAMRVTGMGIVFTSIVLFLGFGVFMLSVFGSTQSLGLLTSVTLLTAMFSNLLLMPALVLQFDRKGSYRGSKALIDGE
jgi:predicted RND superfamily exporter protein